MARRVGVAGHNRKGVNCKLCKRTLDRRVENVPPARATVKTNADLGPHAAADGDGMVGWLLVF